jgi:PAS domain S-box-containing protein
MTDSPAGPDWDRLLVDNNEGYAVLAFDAEGVVQRWNPGAETLFGWAEDEILGRSSKALWTPEDLAKGADVNERETAALAGEAPDERWHLRMGGARVWVRGVTTALLDGGRLVGFGKVCRSEAMRERAFNASGGNPQTLGAAGMPDSAETAGLHRELDGQRAEVRRLNETLAGALAEAVAAEQRRIAGVLHDDLQQLLVGASMQAKMLRAHGVNDRGATPAERVSRAIDDAIATTRSLTARLVPPDVLTAPVPRALAWLAQTYAEVHGLRVVLDVGDVDGGVHATIGGHVRLLVFEATRELLFNVVKHAGTDEARVAARSTGRTLTVVVEDAGVGVADGAEPGYGLAAVRRHLGAIGGALRVVPLPGGGTRAVIRVPCDSLDPPRRH